MPNNIAIYPGTFDPITNGHTDLIIRASRLFHRVIVAIATNPSKQPFFKIEERVALAQSATTGIKNVQILPFDNLLVDFTKQQGAKIIIRGLRAVSDFEYEFQLAGMNRKLEPDLETIFLMPAEKYTYISSSLVREVAKLGGNIADFVHSDVALALQTKYSQITS